MIDFRELFDEAFAPYAIYDTHVDVESGFDHNDFLYLSYAFETERNRYVFLVTKLAGDVDRYWIVARVCDVGDRDGLLSGSIILEGPESVEVYGRAFLRILANEMRSLWHPSRRTENSSTTEVFQ